MPALPSHSAVLCPDVLCCADCRALVAAGALQLDLVITAVGAAVLALAAAAAAVHGRSNRRKSFTAW